MVSYSGPNRPESKTAYVSSSLPSGGTGGEACRLRLHLVSIAHGNIIRSFAACNAGAPKTGSRVLEIEF